jgi:chromosome segregation protein
VHLKSLTLKGFKSFAQPTTFVFEPGVTCVVGPNGSGKSNVVDALAWVMGEQGAKTLRGGSMEDVIFAGTTSKAPLGRAEVLLTIDNSDGALAIEYAEVTISRTLFRNGGSEYAINKEPCRLLDVQELLSDSGLGREMHVIVGQGQLDQVLHASAEDRRRFIEEAAGILKHRRRKEKTQRKLESMQANLTRLNDLAGEIRRQLTPLGRQAEIAREAQTIQAVVRDAKARVLADDVVALSRAIDDFHLSEKERASERATLAEQLDQHRRRIAELESGDTDEALDHARRVSFGLRGTTERLVALESIATERARAWEEETPLAQGSATIQESDIHSSEETLANALADVLRHETSVGEISAVLATEKASVHALEAQMLAQAAAVATYDDQARAWDSALEVLDSKVNTALDDAERQQAALSAARVRSHEAQRALTNLEGQRTSAPDFVSAATEKALEEAEQELAQADQVDVDSRNLVHQQEREREALAAKVSALELALRSDEADPGLGGEPGVRGRVADALTVKSGYETAIARALGSRADALLITSKSDAKKLMTKRSGSEAARVELVIADGAAVKPSSLQGLEPAASCVEGPAGVLALLAGTFIAADTASATAVWEKGALPVGVTIVTLAGDVFSDHVVQTGSGQAPSRLELAAERDRAQADLTAVSTLLERTKFQAEEATVAKQQASEAVKKALGALREADAQRAQFGEHFSRARAAFDAAEAEVSRLMEGVGTAEESLKDTKDALVAAQAERLVFLATPRPIVDDAAKVERLASLERVSSAEVDARIALEASRERARSAKNTLQALKNRLADEEAAKLREEARHQERVARAKRATIVLALLPRVLAAANACVDEATHALGVEEAKRESRSAELQQLRVAESALRDRVGAITESVHSIEMQIYEKKLHRTTLLERVSVELGFDEQTLLGEYSPDALIPPDSLDDGSEPTAFDRVDQEARLKQAQRKLDQLGRVNPLALEEFQALEKRHTFLRAQLEDLQKTRKDLESIMAELDETMHAIFHEAFVDTQNAFDEVFPILFPGGTGSLSLTNPDDLLATGIEVSVRPAGKKIERLSLLSGGERSLAAVALLIAIFKARPSPFYILDEVEATLDDANLGRLLSVIETLRHDSQLIVITHQKRTMEIADALYGVSMRKDGVSAVVGQRVRDTEAIAS